MKVLHVILPLFVSCSFVYSMHGMLGKMTTVCIISRHASLPIDNSKTNSLMHNNASNEIDELKKRALHVHQLQLVLGVHDQRSDDITFCAQHYTKINGLLNNKLAKNSR